MLLMIAAAHATLVASALDPEALAVLSDATAFGDVTELRTVFENNQIWTVATLDLVDLDGQADVWIPGGCIGGLCMTVAGTPWVRPGERVFVFLRDREPTSLAQGLFHVKGDIAERDTSGLAFLDGSTPEPRFDVDELRAFTPVAPPRPIRRR